jgi:branched-subunit amino acid ABC-type transport system permease component
VIGPVSSLVKNCANCGRWLAKLDAYAFYVLRSTFRAAWNDTWEEWKALLVLSVATVSVGLTIASVISICLQKRVLLPQSKAEFVILWGMVGLSLIILNYYSLVSGRKWSRFEEEFESRSKMNRVIGGIAVWVSLILIVAVSEWTGSIAWKLPPFG